MKPDRTVNDAPDLEHPPSRAETTPAATREPLVSVVTPAFDVETFVDEAVRSALAQTWRRLEIVAVDDGSRDGTADRLARLVTEAAARGRAMTVLSRDHAGCAAATNSALAAARGELICFCDADDRIDPSLVERMVSALQADADLDLVFPRYRYIGEDGAPLGRVSARPRERYDLEKFLVENPIECTSGVVARASALRAAGLLDEQLDGCVHLDLFLRVVRPDRANAGGIDAVLTDYRRRAGQTTGDWRRVRRNWRRMIARRQASDGPPGGRAIRRAKADQSLFWSAIAYQRGEFRDAWRLLRDAALADPLRCAVRRDAWVRLAACAASLLPPGPRAVLSGSVGGRRP